jgi:Ca2+-binding RTX toxin-like protein
LKRGNVDTIYKMDVQEDSIELKHKIFSGLEKGKLDADQFKLGKNSKGDEAQILYSKDNLLYDPDGAGSEDAVKFANVPKDKDITHDFFFVV